MSKWTQSSLAEIAELRFGKTPPRSEARFWNPSRGYPWATIADMRADPVLETAETVSEAGLPYSGRPISTGSILMSFKLTVGRVARAGTELLTNEAIVSVHGLDGKADDRWLYHALPSIARGGVTDTAVKGSTLNKAKLEKLIVHLPPLGEQRRIAEVLDTIDEAIHAAERAIDKHLNIERGLRRDLLDGEFAGARFEDWTQCRIGDFASVQRGASPRPIDNPAWFSPDGPGWIRISDVTAADDVLLRTRDHLSPAGVARSRCVRPGDVIMSIAATIGVAIVVGIEACYHDGFVRIDHDGSVVPEFLVMLLEHHKQDFIRSGQTGTQANINSRIVAATQVSLPSLDIQSEIVTAALAVRGAIRAEKDSCRALHAMRAGLADDLLSGRVRTVAA